MATHEKNPLCETLVRKLTSGVHLDDAEKLHLGACEACLAEVVRNLDESAMKNIPVHSEANGATIHPRPEAITALEKGRQVFEREFGIPLSRE
jgi:hypothetical protein